MEISNRAIWGDSVAVYKMKIREKYIEAIISGKKKREYRLLDESRQRINVGDILVLVSTQDSNNYVKVVVSSIKTYRSWTDAIEQYWHDDFDNIYQDKEMALKDCYRFYTKEQVDKYGIVVFSIKKDQLNFESSRILLDTNIIIQRESHDNVSFDVAHMYRWMDKLKYTKIIHPIIVDEIRNHTDEKIKTAMLKKVTAYEELVPDKTTTNEFESVVNQYSLDENSLKDNQMLLQVYNRTVDFLITNDRNMHVKAEKLYLKDRVYNVAEFLKILEDRYPSRVDYKMLEVKLKKFGDVNLKNDFFDTLREDYKGIEFDQWFIKHNSEPAYVFQEKEDIYGFLYLKVEHPGENYSDIDPVFTPKKRLKVGTFKIRSSGFRLGERFIKIIIDNALKNKVEEIYVTLFEDKREEVQRLRDFMKDWGFVYYGRKNQEESVFIKNMLIYDNTKDAKFNFPILKKDLRYFILPIEPQYHTDLFPDSILKNENMNLYKENMAHRYALEKIYVSGKANISAKSGDIVLIYRKGDRYPKKYSSVLTGRAIIQEISYYDDIDIFTEVCKNRSIFDKNELSDLFTNKKYKTMIKLLNYDSFDVRPTLEFLHDIHIVDPQSGPRPFTEVTKVQYESIVKLAKKEETL